MGQYRIGTVDVTNGSKTVIGHGTVFLTKVSVADSFKVASIDSIYSVGLIVSDTELTLASNWVGATATGQSYQVGVDRTTFFAFGEIWAGDKDWPYHLTQTIRRIDQIIKHIADKAQYTTTTMTTSTTTTTTSSTISTSSTSSTISTTSSTISTTSSTSSTISTTSTTTTGPP